MLLSRAFYLTFEQVVDLLRIMKQGDTGTKADLYFSMCDVENSG